MRITDRSVAALKSNPNIVVRWSLILANWALSALKKVWNFGLNRILVFNRVIEGLARAQERRRFLRAPDCLELQNTWLAEAIRNGRPRR